MKLYDPRKHDITMGSFFKIHAEHGLAKYYPNLVGAGLVRADHAAWYDVRYNDRADLYDWWVAYRRRALT